MPSARPSEPTKAYWAFAALGPFAIYGVVLALLGIPFIQKQQVYGAFGGTWGLELLRLMALNRVLMKVLTLTPTQGFIRPQIPHPLVERRRQAREMGLCE